MKKNEKMIRIIHVVGARPNFMKVAPVMTALATYSHIQQRLIHTGQHYDANMSDIFFRQLGLPEPDVNLEVGSASHAVQTAQIMMRFERVVLEQNPDLVLVYGDVNSTVAAALVCAKLGVKVGHVEAGLRSFDRTMPEEINRLMTDQIADILFTPSVDGNENLAREGVASTKIHFVGNVMIDTLIRLLPKTEHSDILKRLNLSSGQFGLITLHRPANVDDPTMLKDIMDALMTIARETPLVFPIHPRTRKRLSDMNYPLNKSQILLTEPLGYIDFLTLQKHARLVITDSGGVQEETTYLGVRCLTVRPNTERPVTVSMGTNILVGQDMQRLKQETFRILEGEIKTGEIPPLWDGRAGDRIARIIIAAL